MKKVCVVLLLLVTAVVGASKGKDGDFTVTGNQVVNYFTGLTAVNNVGGVTLTVTDINELTDGAGIYASTALSAGDMVMLYQAQGASFSDSTNTATYGAFNLNSAGRYEIYEVISVTGDDILVAENGTLCDNTSLIYSYDFTETQVIRMPQFENLTIGAGNSIITNAWNGSRGGVIAVDVNDTVTVNGQINAAASGFRGGVVDNVTTGANTDVTLYRGTAAANGAEKGESILGFQTEYDINGRYGRGAPANGGGGGNAHNGGGGGGANGNNGVTWNGQGNPDNTPVNWTAAWNIDGTLTSATTSSGGGRGGYTYGSADRDAITEAPGLGVWGGNNRRERGGLGGRPLPFDDVGRLFFGGGGGAGDGNNGRAGAGGTGGGLIYIITNNLAGSGTINANGQVGFNTANNGGNNDAPGGGGAGGTIVISANATTASVNLTANGGKGGDQLMIGNENEGPGGGGGGGVISVSGGTGTPVANGGANGITQSGSLTEFLANGATIGGSGQPNETTTSVPNLPVCRGISSISTDKALTDNADEDGSTTVTENDTLEFTITVTNTGDFPLTNVVVTDNLINPTGGTTPCANVPVAGTCTLIGTYVVTSGDVTTGSITNTGSGDSDQTGQVDDILITPVVGSPALIVDKALTLNADEDGSTTVTENDTLTYTVTVTNTGNIPLTNVVVTDNLINPTGGTTPCANVPVAGTCTLIGTYVVTSGDVTTGSITNTGSGDSDQTGQVDDILITPVVGSPALSIEKLLTLNADEDGSTTVTENDTLTYTVTVTNSGNIPLTNVVVTDNLINPTGGTTPCANVPVAGTCTLIGNYVVTSGDVTTGSITNTGSGDSDQTGQVDDILITPVVGTPDLSVNKTLTNNADEDGSTTITEGDTLTYTITATNSGNIPLTNVVVTDNLINPTGGTTPCANVPVAGTCTLIGTYVVTSGDVTTGTITNTGSANSDQTGQVDDVLITPIVGSPELTVAKTLTSNADEDGSTTITEGDTLTYTITATNSGNIPLTNVVVTDNLINPTGGTTPCANVPVAGTCTLIGTYVVTSGDVTTGSITNTGSADSDQTGQVDDVLITPIVGSPELTVAKTLTNNADEDGSTTVTEGDTLTYTITATNSGNIPLTNVVVTDNLITPTGGTTPCANVPVAGSCTLIGTYVVTAGDVTTGSITNTGSANSDQTGQVDDVLITPVVGTPALSIVKTLTSNDDEDGSGTITLNDTLNYSIVATNNGNTTLNNVVVTDTMIMPNSITCITLAPGMTCELMGTYVVQQSDVDNGEIVNTGTVDSDETDPEVDVVITVLGSDPELSIDKSLTANADEDASGSITLNDTLTFTIVVTNSGNVTLNNVLVTDDMITPDNITCAVLVVGDTCELIGTYVVQQSDVDNGQIVNVAVGVSDETITDPETDIEVVVTEGPVPDPVLTPTLGQWALLLLSLLTLVVASRSLAHRQR